MKKYIVPLLLLLIAATWLYFTFAKEGSLGSLQQLANYRRGVLAMEPYEKEEEKQVQGTMSGVRIAIDTLDIPHVFARDANGLAYGTGYMHARERYFQMELVVHTVMGRLAEMIGSPGIPSDKLWKMFELEQRAAACLDSLKTTEPGLYQYLLAYAAGVNDYLAVEKSTERDPLYAIWDYEPAPWQPWYPFLVQWYLGFDLTFYDDYIDRQEVLDKLPPTIRQALYPGVPVEETAIIPGGKPVNQPLVPEKGIVRLFQPSQVNTYNSRPSNPSLGSNNWVIGKTHTQTGGLFLCNDLHLALVAPNIFYELQVAAPGIHAYGFSIPGEPFIVTGHNERIAWGITNGGWDVTEQYLLRINPDNPSQYWYNGQWTAMEERSFELQVKDGNPEKHTVRYTKFGPLVQKDSISYGLRWHPASSCTALQSFWKLMQAANWNDFRNALKTYDYPAQNFVYGDVEGNIGMVCAGKMPVKPAGYSGGLLNGTIAPLTQYIEFDSLPQAYNPSRDYLFSANQDPQQGSSHYFSSRWFDDLSRPRRIDDLLSAHAKMTREDVRHMQADVTDISTRYITRLLEKYGAGERLSADWEAMKGFDGVLQPGNKQAVFYKVFRQAVWLYRGRVAQSLGVKAPPTYDQFMHFLVSQDTLALPTGHLSARTSFLDIVRLTDSLFAQAGGAGNYNPYAFNIPQITYLPGLARPVNDVGGSDNTINVNYDAHAVIRTLVSIDGQRMQSWMVNATGQTGRLNEKNYFQQLDAWKKNEPHKTQFTQTADSLTAIKTRIVFR